MRRFLVAAALPAQLLTQLTVCPDCEIRSIQEALRRAAPQATITVRGGTYQEGTLKIERPVRLVGMDHPVLEGGNAGQDLVSVTGTSGFVLQGFTLRHTGMSYIKEVAGVKLEGSSDCLIRGNRFEETNFGVYLSKTTRCQVDGNELRGLVNEESDAANGNGIHLWQGTGNVIRKNSIARHRDGIYFEFVADSTIEDNEVFENTRYGLHFMKSDRNLYRRNAFFRNGSGVAVMYSRSIRMIENRFNDNAGPAAYGLLMKDITDSEVRGNEFSKNSVGIFMEGTNRSRFNENVLASNGWAFRVMGDCEGNRFEQNDVIGNTFDVATNSSRSLNTFDHNHWSSYDGYDLDGDGIGDRPFRLVSLSSVILEQVDSSFSLLRSPLFSLLDSVERALPELTPESLKDEAPLMKPRYQGGAR